MSGNELSIVLIVFVILIIADTIIFYVAGYKAGRRDEGIDWAEKEDYYKWLLEMKKRQDFEEVKIVPAKKTPKEKKVRQRCDICGKIIKKGSLCYECQRLWD